MEESTQDDNRRDVLCKILSFAGICALGTASAIFPGCESTSMKSTNKGETFDIGSAPELANVGGSVKETFGTNNGGLPVMIIRKATNVFVVLTTVCTHQGCEVDLPLSAGANIQCPCHGSKFSSADGSVVSGLANSPLRKYIAEYDAKTNILTITF